MLEGVQALFPDVMAKLLGGEAAIPTLREPCETHRGKLIDYRFHTFADGARRHGMLLYGMQQSALGAV